MAGAWKAMKPFPSPQPCVVLGRAAERPGTLEMKNWAWHVLNLGIIKLNNQKIGLFQCETIPSLGGHTYFQYVFDGVSGELDGGVTEAFAGRNPSPLRPVDLRVFHCCTLTSMVKQLQLNFEIRTPQTSTRKAIVSSEGTISC